MRVPLEPAHGSFGFPVVIAGLPSFGPLSYGLLLVIALIAAEAALVWGRRVPWLLGTAGFAVAALVLLFVTATLLDDNTFVQHIHDQTAEYNAIVNQLGYRIVHTAPSSVLLLPIGGNWRMVMQSFQAGWYVSLIGGLLIFGAGLPQLLRSLRSHTKLAVGYAMVLVAVSGLAIARPLLSGVVEGGAVDAAYKGRYTEAVGDYNAALRLNPTLIDNTTFALNLGTALRATGDSASPWAQLSRAREYEASGNLQGELVLIRDSLGKAPASPVLRSEYLRVARRLAQSAGMYDTLSWAANQGWGDLTGEHYLLGRGLYATQSYSAAWAQFNTVVNSANDRDVESSAYTYEGLCALGLGSDTVFRADLLHAVDLDNGYFNVFARTLTTGLFVTGPPK